MPGSTSLGFPYPLSTDAPDGPGGIEALADAVDAYLSGLTQARVMSRDTTLNVDDSTDTLVGSYNLGVTYNVGGISYASGVLTVSVAGLYRWELESLWPSDSGAASYRRVFSVQVNGSDRQEGRTAVPFDDAAHASMHHTAGGLIELAASDGIQAVIWQNSGGTLAVTPQFFSLARVG